MLTVMYVLAYIIAATIGMSVVVGVGTLTLSAVSVYRERKAANPPVMSFKESTAALPPREKTVFDCAVYDQRLFERELVEAKVLDNIESRCEDKECPECYPNRPGNGVPTIAPDKVRRREAPEIGTVKKEAWTSERIAKAKAEKKRAAEAFAKSRAGRQRVAEVGGRVVPIPNNVPKFATGQLIYDSGMLTTFIGWRWHDEDDARKPIRSFRQNISQEVFDRLPLAGKKEPFTTMGGNQMIVCRVCSDTYYVRPGSTGPVDTFTCQRCKHNTPRGNTLPRPPKGNGAGSPVKPKNALEELNRVLKNQTEQLKREQELLKQEKCKIEALNKRLMELHSDHDKIRRTPSTGPR
jgi:hypothetical protein